MGPQPAVGQPRTTWAKYLVYPGAVWLLSRAFLLFNIYGLSVFAPLLKGRVESFWGGALNFWDAGLYASIAVHGYNQIGSAPNSVAFFPAYPALLRYTSVITGLAPIDLAAPVTMICSLVAVLLLWVLVYQLVDDRKLADRACLIFSFFPGTFVLSSGYSEGLMLALAVGCLLALLKERWLIAGLLAALATATRPNAIALVAACTWAAVVAIKTKRQWWALLAPALAPLGFIGYMIWLRVLTGSWTAWSDAQRKGWQEYIDFGWNLLKQFWAWITNPFGLGVTGAAGLNSYALWVVGLSVIFLVISAIFMFKWKPPGFVFAYTYGIIGLSIISHTLGPRPRFIMTAFPLIVAVAIALKERWVGPVVAVSAGLLSLLTTISLLSLLITP